LRNPVIPKLLAVFVPYFGWMAVTADDSDEAAIWWSGIVLIVFSLWPRVIVEADGLTVINVRRRHIRWQDIQAVEWRNRFGQRMLSFELAGGRRRGVWAVCTGGLGRAWTYRTYDDLLACWQAATTHGDRERQRAHGRVSSETC
jgi:hypothetical protein